MSGLRARNGIAPPACLTVYRWLARRETTTLRIDKVKGNMFVNQYLVVKFLGRGACGKVFLCLNTYDLRLYAMKVRRRREARDGSGLRTG